MHWRSLMKLLPENISFDQIRQFGTFIGLILLCALFTLLSPYFLTASNLMNVAQRSEEHTSELQSRAQLVCRLLLEKKKAVARVQAWTNMSQAAQAFTTLEIAVL